MSFNDSYEAGARRQSVSHDPNSLVVPQKYAPTPAERNATALERLTALLRGTA